MVDCEVQAVLSCYGPGPDWVRQIERLGNAGGWSGSRLWRVNGSDGSGFCLRRWPQEHPTPERLRLIHAVLGLVGPQMLIVAEPLLSNAGTTFVEHARHLWELTRWLPGAADFRARPTTPRLRAAMHALARFHELASRYEQRKGVAPAVADRYRRLQGLRKTGLSLIEAALARPLGNEIDSQSGRLFALCKKVLENSPAVDALAGVPELPLQPAVRDIHHDHVLFTGDDVTGLIDFGAMKIDTPLTDVARLMGSLVGDDGSAREFALDAYWDIRPLSMEDCNLVEWLDETGLIIGGLNWLVWLYAERRDMGPVGPIVRRLNEILGRLEWRVEKTFL
jgi:Ser/Thr protein kinase RdoA (MazF antagonist)